MISAGEGSSGSTAAMRSGALCSLTLQRSLEQESDLFTTKNNKQTGGCCDIRNVEAQL